MDQKHVRAQSKIRARQVAGWLAAILLGLIYTWDVVGFRVINPLDTSWITADPAMNQVGFEAMRQESLLTFPPTWSHKLGYPFGTSTAFLDDIPLFATAFKFLGPLLPAQFQYLGLFLVLSATLQFYFGQRLAREITGSAVAGWIGGLFFLAAPPATWRAFGHFALSAQWLLLAALYYVIQKDQHPRASEYRWALPLMCALAASIHPYLLLMTLIVCGLALLRRLALSGRWPGAAPVLLTGVACGLATLASLVVFGYVLTGGPAFATSGFGLYSMDLLAPIDPESFPSLLLRNWPIEPNQFEGYNYLGAGVVLMGAVAITRRVATGHPLPAHIPGRWLLPMVVATALLAASTKITLGGAVIADISLPQRLAHAMAVVRASGRLFWPGYYALYILILAALQPRGRAAAAIGMMIAVLGFQLADTASLRQAIHRRWEAVRPANPLTDPIWTALPTAERHLSLVPALPCSVNVPGGLAMAPVFSRFALSHGMTIDSFRSARDGEAWLNYLCASPARLQEQGFEPDTAYVLGASEFPTLLQLRDLGRMNGRFCGMADGFILCSTAWGRTGLEPALVQHFLRPLRSETLSFDALADGTMVLADFEVTSAFGARSLGHQSGIMLWIDPSIRADPVHISIDAGPILPGPASRQRVTIRAGTQELLRTMVGPGPTPLAFDVPPSAIRKDGILTLTFDLPDAISPREAGVNTDERLFGIALFTLDIRPARDR